MVLVNNLKFCQRFVLTIKKTPLKTIRTTLYKRRKVRIFPDGLVNHFSQKFTISSTSIFIQNQPRKSIWERSS